ncbi:MAG: hypothetical protein AABN33_25295 [Acidobacteriota bacterium]
MKNKSLENERVFKKNGLTFTEIIRQEYGKNNCIISAGFVKGKNKPKVDTCYLRLEKDNVEPTVLLLRPDEIQSIAWVTSGTVWAHLVANSSG